MADSGIDRDRRKWLTGAVGGAVAASFLVPSAEAQPGPGPVSLILGTGAGQALPGPYGATTFLPTNYGSITDGGRFGDGLSHPASANGFSTLAALQTQFRAASFTATGSGTNLTVTGVTGLLYQGLTLGATTGIGTSIRIIGQTSGTPNGAGVYVTSSATTISGATATASWASSTSNDMAGLMIEAAINAGSVNGGIVWLPNGIYYNLPSGLLFPSYTNSRLIGFPGTILLCSPCVTAGNPAGTICAAGQCDAPIEGVQLWASDVKQFGTVPGDGTPNTGIFTSGSAGIHFVLCEEIVVRNMVFQNFDECSTWDTVVGGDYMVSFRDCTYVLNNKAAVINAIGAPNSFERMSWDNCGFGSNNYAAWICFSSSATLGSGVSIAADAYFINCSFDYSCVLHIWYNGGSGNGDELSSLYCSCCHFETNTTTSGTGTRCRNGGVFSLSQCEIFENGSNPSSFLENANLYGIVSIISCKAPGFPANDASAVPFIGTDSTGAVQGYGNFSRGGGGSALLINTTNGGVNSFIPTDTRWFGFSADGSLAYYTPINRDIPVTATCNITVNPASTTNFMTGTTFRFVTVPAVTGTFVAGGGVTITSSGVGLTFGGAIAKNVTLMKTGFNSWSASGGMT